MSCEQLVPLCCDGLRALRKCFAEDHQAWEITWGGCSKTRANKSKLKGKVCCCTANGHLGPARTSEVLATSLWAVKSFSNYGANAANGLCGTSGIWGLCLTNLGCLAPLFMPWKYQNTQFFLSLSPFGRLVLLHFMFCCIICLPFIKQPCGEALVLTGEQQGCMAYICTYINTWIKLFSFLFLARSLWKGYLSKWRARSP